MEIRIHSFGTPESLDLRNILEGMYRRTGEVSCVLFPDDNSTLIKLDEMYDCENEYGIHRMIRTSPRSEDGNRQTSHVMVEINGKTRPNVVCTYTFDPEPLAINHITGKATKDIYYVLSGRPLEMKMKTPSILTYQFA